MVSTRCDLETGHKASGRNGPRERSTRSLWHPEIATHARRELVCFALLPCSTLINGLRMICRSQSRHAHGDGTGSGAGAELRGLRPVLPWLLRGTARLAVQGKGLKLLLGRAFRMPPLSHPATPKRCSPTPTEDSTGTPPQGYSSPPADELTSLLSVIRRKQLSDDASALDDLLRLSHEVYMLPTRMKRTYSAESPERCVSLSSDPDNGLDVSWFARLLEAVTESELGNTPCRLHRARLNAVKSAVEFFCRVKGKGACRQDGWHTVPEVCRDDMKRRLRTYTAALQSTLPRADVDSMRRDDLLATLVQLESSWAPLDITLRSVLLPLLEALCQDVLMAGALPRGVWKRLEDDLGAIKVAMAYQGASSGGVVSSPGGAIWRTADSIWRIATSQPRTPPNSYTSSPLAAVVGPRVDALLSWLHDSVHKLRAGACVAEIEEALPVSLRTSLRSQEYTSRSEFLEIFEEHAHQLKALRLPAPPVGCPPTCPHAHECVTLAGLSLEQARRDLQRERISVNGSVVEGAKCEGMVVGVLRGFVGHSIDVSEAVRRTLLAASRTGFGGDAFFLVKDLFGGEGVVLAPASHRDPADGILNVEIRQLPSMTNIVLINVRSKCVYNVYSQGDIELTPSGVMGGGGSGGEGARGWGGSQTAAMAGLRVTMTETLAFDVKAGTKELVRARIGAGGRVACVEAVEPRRVVQ